LPEPLHAEQLRAILRRFAAGVTVITAVGDEGAPAGMTATAFTSVSLAPPMVLICVDATARTRRAIEGREAFAVNVLAADQEHVARRFASKVDDKFEGVAWRPGSSGVPVIEGALAMVECRVARAVEAGTHVVYIGEVLTGSESAGDPLVYFDGSYRVLGEIAHGE
jgi:flavin reductase (DIM6/NTAB) family NADH-FMN oxidoreductase RutF